MAWCNVLCAAWQRWLAATSVYVQGWWLLASWHSHLLLAICRYADFRLIAIACTHCRYLVYNSCSRLVFVA
jgi:hypothetical protein